MKTILGVVLGLGAIAIAAIAVSKSKKKIPMESETVNGNLKMSDVVGYFKMLQLVKGKDVPFIARASRFKDVINTNSAKPQSLVLGVFNQESNEFNPVKVIFCDGFDEKLLEVLGNEDLVVLN